MKDILINIACITGLTAYWIGMFLWMKLPLGNATLLATAALTSIIGSVLMFFGFWTRPKGGWKHHTLWGPLMVVLGFASLFFFLMTLIKMM